MSFEVLGFGKLPVAVIACSEHHVGFSELGRGPRQARLNHNVEERPRKTTRDALGQSKRLLRREDAYCLGCGSGRWKWEVEVGAYKSTER